MSQCVATSRLDESLGDFYSSSEEDYREESRSRDNSMPSKGVYVPIKNLAADLDRGINQHNPYKRGKYLAISSMITRYI